MQTLIYLNEKNEKITFGYKGNIILEHLDLGAVTIDKITTKSVGQDGVKLYDNNLDSRVLTAECCLIGETEKERFEIRREIGRILNPNYKGELLYNNGFKDYKIAAGLNLAINWGEMLPNRTIQRFDVVFFCPDPYFNDFADTSLHFLEVTPRLVFPLKIKVPGFIFSSLAGGELVLDNKGDAPTPVKITIYGPVTNPTVTNLTTGETIRVNYSLNSSEKIEITTYFSNKRITIIDANGNSQNAMHYLDTSQGVSFFWLQPGRNILRFSADVGEDLGRMTVSFNNRYLIV